MIERAAALGDWLGPRLEELARPRPVIAEVRGIGLLWALELCVPGAAGERGREPLGAAAMGRLAASLRARHLHMHKRDNLLYLAPPLVITRDELDQALGLIGAALDEALS